MEHPLWVRRLVCGLFLSLKCWMPYCVILDTVTIVLNCPSVERSLLLPHQVLIHQFCRHCGIMGFQVWREVFYYLIKYSYTSSAGTVASWVSKCGEKSSITSSSTHTPVLQALWHHGLPSVERSLLLPHQVLIHQFCRHCGIMGFQVWREVFYYLIKYSYTSSAGTVASWASKDLF